MDHVSRVEYFLAVVKQESFAGAARALGTSGPAVSKQVQALERSLGVKLLTRTTRHVSLTEEGAIYYQGARKAVEDLREAEQQIQDLKSCPTGKLKINAPMSFGSQFLTKPIAKFARQYPDLELEVDFSDRWVDVVAEGYDVLIRIAQLNDSNLVARKLAPCPIVLCAANSLLEHHGTPSLAEDLNNFPAVVYNRHSQKEVWVYRDENGEKGSLSLKRVFAANTAEMQLAACLEGVGLALLPIFSVYKYLETGALVQVLPSYSTEPERGIYAMYPQTRYLSTRTRLFIDYLSKESEYFPWC